MADNSGSAALGYLKSQGYSDLSIEEAVADGTLSFLVIEALFRGDAQRFTVSELADRVGQPVDVVVRIRRALGFPDADPHDLVGTDGDVATIRTLLEGTPGMSIALALQQVRMAAAAMIPLADAIGEAFGRGLSAMLEADNNPVALADAALDENTPSEIITMMTHTLRQQMAAAIARERSNRLTDAELGHRGLKLSVGFIDVVGSTETMEALDLVATAEYVRRFEATAHDEIARGGGRLVKMLGDGALYVASVADDAVSIAGTLLAAAGHDGIPAARAGVATGRVVRLNGDVYGQTVNRASRLCGTASVNELLVDSATVAELGDHRAVPAGTRTLRGIGEIESFRLA